MRKNVIDGSPTKEFIISTITKDITIEAAIFDFIDNSINAANKLKTRNRLGNYYVDIKITPTSLIIKDNCGGFTKEKILAGALRIGSSLEYKSGHGIGMKRAFLKFGCNICIHSNNKEFSFSTNIDVKSWGSKDSWDIHLSELDFNFEESEGVTIEITELYKEISEKFQRNILINNIFNRISTYYRYKLASGFSIIINDKPVEGKFITGENVAESPWYVSKERDIRVKVILYKVPFGVDNGWDIIFNGRCIIERDKSKLTLWRKRIIAKGCSYDRFVGEVLVEGENIKKLPILSTKDGLDIDSKNYQFIINTMYSLIEANRDKFKKKEVYIQYEKPYDKVQLLLEKYGVTNAKQAGEDSFEEALNNYIINGKRKY